LISAKQPRSFEMTPPPHKPPFAIREIQTKILSYFKGFGHVVKNDKISISKLFIDPQEFANFGLG